MKFWVWVSGFQFLVCAIPLGLCDSAIIGAIRGVSHCTLTAKKRELDRFDVETDKRTVSKRYVKMNDDGTIDYDDCRTETRTFKVYKFSLR